MRAFYARPIADKVIRTFMLQQTSNSRYINITRQ